MKRPAGLVASVVVLTLLSLLHLVWAFGVAVAVFLAGRVPAGEPGSHSATSIFAPSVLTTFYGLDLFILGLGIWGILTAFGLRRLHNWARNSVLIIGGGMAVIDLFNTLCTLVMIFVPPPMLPDTDAKQTQMMHEALKVGIVFGALVYGAMLAIGVWWLAYFNRQNVRALFIGANGTTEENPRPLLISVIAVLLLLGTIFCLLMAFVPLPCLIFALILHGWAKILFLLVYAVLSAATAIGLWQLNEWARRSALALLAFGAINCLIYLLRPSLLLVGLAGNASKSTTPELPPFWHYFQFMMQVELVLPTVLFIAIAFMLHYYRDKFREPTAPPPLVSLPPQPDALDS